MLAIIDIPHRLSADVLRDLPAFALQIERKPQIPVREVAYG